MFCRMSDSLPRAWAGARGWRRKAPWSGALPSHVVPPTWLTSAGADVGAETGCAHKLLGIPLKADASLLAVYLFTQSLITPVWASGY